MKNRKTDTTSNSKQQSANLPFVRLKKPHPCGGTEFTVVREGPVVTLRCQTCQSFIRMPRDKFEKTVSRV
jgi:hypothetical protein